MRQFDFAQRKQEKGFIVNILAIIVVLGIVFLSQNPQKMPEWVKTNIYPKISIEVQNRGGELAQQANTAKNNFAQNIWDEIKNYFAQKFNGIFKTEVK